MKSRPLTSNPRLKNFGSAPTGAPRPQTVTYQALKGKKKKRTRAATAKILKAKIKSVKLPSLPKGKRKAKIKFYNDVAMIKSGINRLGRHNTVLKTKIKNLQDDQKKFRNCIDLLKSNLKDELISVPQNKLEIPLTIAMKRRIKILRNKLTIVNSEIKNTNLNLDRKWLDQQDRLDKLKRKLRNYILNIEFRKNISDPNMKLDKSQEELANIAEDQNSLSDPLYKEFETVCNGIRKDEALKMDILSRLQVAPMMLKEKKAIIEELTKKDEEKEVELTTLKVKLGIQHDQQIDEIMEDNTGVVAHKRRQKNFKKNIDLIQHENDEMLDRISEFEDQTSKLMVEQNNVLDQMKNERAAAEKKQEELKKKINAAKKRRRELDMQRRLTEAQQKGTARLESSSDANGSFKNENSSSSEEDLQEEESIELPKKEPVNLRDISHKAQELNLQLRAAEVPFEEVYSLLKEYAYGGMDISIRQAKEFFFADPFNIEDEEIVEKLARYLIEDNDEELIDYDENLTLNVIVVRSILRNLLGAYEIYSEEQTLKIREEIKNQIGDRKDRLKDAIERMDADYGRKHCTVLELQHQMDIYEIILKKEHFDQIVLDLYKVSHNIDKLPFLEVITLYYEPDVDEDDD